MSEPEWVTVAEAVIRTGKGERTIRRIVADHNIDAKQNGRSILWNLPQIRTAISERRPGRSGTGSDQKRHADTRKHLNVA